MSLQNKSPLRFITPKYYTKLIELLWSSIIIFFSYKMTAIIWPYTSWARDVDFLMSKQAIIHLDYYRVAFYSHIFSSSIVLISGAFLFSSVVLKKAPRVHRNIGKTYVLLLLVISAPSGLVMAFHANGGWETQLSFIILSPLWWWTTYKGYTTVRRKEFKAHRRWMMRSYALSLSAITLRISQLLLSKYTYMDPENQYLIVSWGSWIFNLLIVELSFITKSYHPIAQLKLN